MEHLTPHQIAQRFEVQHGPESEHDGGWIYYPDGAMREVNPLGAFVDPPPQEADLFRRKAHYQKLRLARLVREFDRVKAKAVEVARNPTAAYAHEDAVEQLERLRDQVQEAQSRLAAIKEAARFARTGRTAAEEAELERLQAAAQAERQSQIEQLKGIRA